VNVNFNDIDDLKASGFAGFKTIRELWADRLCIPKKVGVYLVLYLDGVSPEYINPGVGGFFKGQNPNVPIDVLEKNQVPNSKVVYIGKAGSIDGKSTLYSRLSQYLSFGQGKNIGHWGGRFIWQLSCHEELVVCWKPTPGIDPRVVERSLIEDFTTQFGRRPFANLAS
jgi:hypothetical protein